MDRFNELRAFIAVVEAGGFSAAARVSGESQPALSKTIGALEKRLGVMLFNRNTRIVTLTDQGQKYYDRTKPLLDGIENADSELASSTHGVSGLIRISAPTTFGRLVVLPVISDLLSLCPDIRLDLMFSDLKRDMVGDGIDLAIGIGRVDEPDAVVRRLGAISLVCAGSRRYLERHGTPKVPADLVDHNCILYDGFGDGADWSFVGPQGRCSVAVRGNLTSNSVDATRGAILGGVGIGVITKNCLVEELQHPDIVTVLDKYVLETRDVNLVWPKRRFVPVRVRHVTDYFAKTLPGRIRS